MSVIWPFPGQPETIGPPEPPEVLPPARYAIGDRVISRWGSATVIAVNDWSSFGSRSYLIRHDWSSAPSGFGHPFSENDLEPHQDVPPALDHDQADSENQAPQLELFS